MRGVVVSIAVVTAQVCPDEVPTTDLQAGGILLYAKGRTATESFYGSLVSAAGPSMMSLTDSRLGGETWKNTYGIPCDAFSTTMAQDRRYAHIKPKHLIEGDGLNDRMHTLDDMFDRAKRAGFTMVAAIYRSNEMGWLMSELEYARSSPSRIEEDVCAHTNVILDSLEEARRQIRRGIIAARKAGFPIYIATFEDVVRDACGVAHDAIEAYNAVSEFKVSNEGCVTTKTVSHSHPPRPFSSRLPARGRACLDKAFEANPSYKWMVENDSIPLDPPKTWRRFFDGTDVGEDTAPPVFFYNASDAKRELDNPVDAKYAHGPWIEREYPVA